MSNPIITAMRAYPSASEDYHVQDVGRPGSKPEEAARRALRRMAFGSRLRALREAAGLSISEAARQAGMTSSRKLAQYETTCYPPGRIVARLAPIYGLSCEQLAQMVLKHSDPEMFEAMTGLPGYQPTRSEIHTYLNPEPEPEEAPAPAEDPVDPETLTASTDDGENAGERE